MNSGKTIQGCGGGGGGGEIVLVLIVNDYAWRSVEEENELFWYNITPYMHTNCKHDAFLLLMLLFYVLLTSYWLLSQLDCMGWCLLPQDRATVDSISYWSAYFWVSHIAWHINTHCLLLIELLIV